MTRLPLRDDPFGDFRGPEKGVVTLVDEEKPTGRSVLRWGDGGFSGGICFYRLQAGKFVETKKLVLVK